MTVPSLFGDSDSHEGAAAIPNQSSKQRSSIAGSAPGLPQEMATRTSRVKPARSNQSRIFLIERLFAGLSIFFLTNTSQSLPKPGPRAETPGVRTTRHLRVIRFH